MTEKKIRMATSDNPKEQGHTIVGGRPDGNTSLASGIPRGLEILVKKAAVDEEFKKELLLKRDKLADEMNLPLDASEKAMLGCVPAEHLEQMINHTQVPENQKRHLVGASAAAIVALITQLTFASPVQAQQKVERKQSIDAPSSQRAAKPILRRSDDFQGLGGIRPDLADRGARPDMPSPSHFPSDFDDEEEFDEELVPVMTRPVHQADPVILNGLPPHHVLEIDIRGLRFFEAINAIADECNIQINYANLSSSYEHKQIEAHVKGQSLGDALLDLCAEYVDADLQCTIHFLNDENRIDIEFHAYDEESAPDLPKDLPKDFGYEKDKINDGPQIVRGIRSDVPRPRPKTIEELDDEHDDPFNLNPRDRK